MRNKALHLVTVLPRIVLLAIIIKRFRAIPKSGEGSFCFRKRGNPTGENQHFSTLQHGSFGI